MPLTRHFTRRAWGCIERTERSFQISVLTIIGARFGEAELRDIAVQSETIAEGSIGSVLTGK